MPVVSKITDDVTAEQNSTSLGQALPRGGAASNTARPRVDATSEEDSSRGCLPINPQMGGSIQAKIPCAGCVDRSGQPGVLSPKSDTQSLPTVPIGAVRENDSNHTGTKENGVKPILECSVAEEARTATDQRQPVDDETEPPPTANSKDSGGNTTPPSDNDGNSPESENQWIDQGFKNREKKRVYEDGLRIRKAEAKAEADLKSKAAAEQLENEKIARKLANNIDEKLKAAAESKERAKSQKDETVVGKSYSTKNPSKIVLLPDQERAVYDGIYAVVKSRFLDKLKPMPKNFVENMKPIGMEIGKTTVKKVLSQTSKNKSTRGKDVFKRQIYKAVKEGVMEFVKRNKHKGIEQGCVHLPKPEVTKVCPKVRRDEKYLAAKKADDAISSGTLKMFCTKKLPSEFLTEVMRNQYFSKKLNQVVPPKKSEDDASVVRVETLTIKLLLTQTTGLKNSSSKSSETALDVDSSFEYIKKKLRSNLRTISQKLEKKKNKEIVEKKDYILRKAVVKRMKKSQKRLWMDLQKEKTPNAVSVKARLKEGIRKMKQKIEKSKKDAKSRKKRFV